MRFIKTTLIALALSITFIANGQKKDIPQFTRAEIDSTSYLVGLNFGSFIKQYGFTQIDHDKMNVGISDFIIARGVPGDEGFEKQFTYNPEDMNDCFNAYLEKKTHTTTEISKASYLVGVNFGSFIKQYNFPGLDYSIVSEGINDYVKAKGDTTDVNFGKQFRYDPVLMNGVFTRALEKQHTIELKSNILQAEEFLSNNAAVSGVNTTSSGLQYKIITKGSTKHPSKNSRIKVLYEAKTVNGAVFDSSMDRSNPTELDLEKVISGWQEGLAFIGEGGHIILYVPSDLAYGDKGSGPVAPGAVSVYDVQLISVLSNPQTVSSSYTPPTSRTAQTHAASQSYSGGLRVEYGKDVNIKVGESVQLKHREGVVAKWEQPNGNIVTVSSSGVLTGKSEGVVNVWGYVNGSPKLFRVTVSGKVSGTQSSTSTTTSSTAKPASQAQTASAQPGLRHGCARYVHGKSFLIRVGESITIKSDQGDVTKLEKHSNSASIAITGQNEITGVKEGESQIWVYIDNSPKLFTVKVKGRPSASASSSGIATTTDNEITMRPNSMIRLSYPGGTIGRLESTNEEIVAAFTNNVIIGLREGATSVWAYVNGSPKLYKVTVSESAPYTPKTSRSSSGGSSSSGSSYSSSSSSTSSSSSIRVAYAPDVTVKVGERVQLKHRDGPVTKWEVTNVNKVSCTDTGIMRGLEVGETVVWGYVNGSPKIFRVKVTR